MSNRTGRKVDRMPAQKKGSKKPGAAPRLYSKHIIGESLDGKFLVFGTRRPMWLKRADNRKRNKVAKQSRKVNR